MTAVAMAAGSGVVKEARYVLTNLSANNNKFWNIRLYEDGTCETHWGRVGEVGQRKTAGGFTESAFDSRCREKQGKGYQAQKTLGNAAAGIDLASEKLAEVAAQQIETDSEDTLKLVTYLARVNIHRILEATTLQYDETTGTFSTPLGVLTADAIAEARKLLCEIGSFVEKRRWDDPAFVRKLNAYYMLVPQNIGRGKPDPGKLFPDLGSVQKQNGILDSLEASLQTVLTKAEQEKTAEVEPVLPQLFEAKLILLEDAKEIARIRAKYRSTRQGIHACRHLDVKRVFRVEIGSMRGAFAERGKKVGGVKELWHGTRAGNLLSILKTGFVIPPAGASYCTGRMFGNGVYFSDQSTKSLNYAYGYWGGGTRDENCYMLLCDVAMGRSYTPRSYTEKLPLAGYDSTFARAGDSGVANNEMIVYNTDQIDPRYLIEFGPAADK